MAVDATLKDRLYARFMSETSLPERACRDIARMAVEEFEGVPEEAEVPGADPVADAPEAGPAVPAEA